MSILLYHPTANTSTSFSAYPAPSAPDVSWCFNPRDRWYSYPQPPQLSDCRKALGLLPSGTESVSYYAFPGEGRDNILPISATYGTCKIAFHTSGPVAEELDPAWIVPDVVRDMAKWVLARCVYVKNGGMVTRGLSNTIDYLTAANTNLETRLPANTSFFSLHIWSSRERVLDWNPGNSDPVVGIAISDSLERAAAAAPAGSTLKGNLDKRHQLVERAVTRMDGIEDLYTWWDSLSAVNPLRPIRTSTHSAIDVTIPCITDECLAT